MSTPANLNSPEMPVKMHLDDSAGTHHITAYGPGYITVNDQRLTRSFIVTPEQLIPDWPPQRFAEIDAASIETILDLAPAITLLGTGARQRFPDPELLAPLMSRGIGIEVMTTAAACRTYNILVAEGRAVLAMLLVPEA